MKRLKDLFQPNKPDAPESAGRDTLSGGGEKSAWDVEPQDLPPEQQEQAYTPDVQTDTSRTRTVAVENARDELSKLFGEQEAASIESQSYAREAPRLVDQVLESGRDEAVVYRYREPGIQGEGREQAAAEHDALVDLDQYLQAACDTADGEVVRTKAKTLRENLTFIGHKEYQEATKGMADYWKSLLEHDDSLQLCIVTGLAAEKPGEMKSDDYVFDSILEQFSDDELGRYRGRLVDSLDAVTTENARVILLDDWVVSGQQMGLSCRKLLQQRPDIAPRLEVQCVATSGDTLTDGLTVDADSRAYRVPVRSYFRTPTNNMAGAHSAPKAGFRYDLETMLDAQKPPRNKLPALATIRTPYSVAGYAPVHASKLNVSGGGER